MSQTNLTNEELLVQLNEGVARTLIPAMVFVGILMTIGLVGNLLVCFVFATKLKQGTQNFMIVCLAVFDLLSCLIAMPTEIVDMRYYYMFDSEFACKLFRFVNVLTAMCSILTLTVIAVDRFFKVCRPLGRQMTLREAKMSVFGSVVTGVLIAWPAFFIFGERTALTELPGVVGTDCSTSDTMQKTSYPLIYNCILFLGFMVLTIVFIFIYLKIYREIKRHKKYMNKIAIATPSSPVLSTVEFNFPSLNSDNCYNGEPQMLPTPKTLPTAPSSANAHENGAINLSFVSDTGRTVTFKSGSSLESGNTASSNEVSGQYNSMTDIRSNHSKVKIIPPPLRLPERGNYCESDIGSTLSACSTPRKKHQSKLELGRESRTTVIAVLVTTVFVLSYLPYLGLVFAAIFHKDFDHQLQGLSLTAFNLFLRSYFVNAAANPIIYGVLNYRFRLQVTNFIQRVSFWKS